MSKRTPTVQPRPGQLWSSSGIRDHGRLLRVDAVDGQHAMCTVLTNSNRVQRELDMDRPNTRDGRGRAFRIRVDRMRPTANGYQYEVDADLLSDLDLQALKQRMNRR